MATQARQDDGQAFDSRGQAEIEGRADEEKDGAKQGASPAPAQPPAGPHAKAELTDPEATPGTGSLPSPTVDDEADAATG